MNLETSVHHDHEGLFFDCLAIASSHVASNSGCGSAAGQSSFRVYTFVDSGSGNADCLCMNLTESLAVGGI